MLKLNGFVADLGLYPGIELSTKVNNSVSGYVHIV